MSVKMKVVQGKPHGAYLDFPDGEFIVGRGPECHVRPDGEFIVGCEPECQVRPNSEPISWQHCLLRIHDHVVHVCDLGSTSGILVNGKMLIEVCTLGHGDTLQIGSIVLKLVLDTPDVIGGPTAMRWKRELAACVIPDELSAVAAPIREPHRVVRKESEVERLFAIITHQGVEAVSAEIQDRKDLIEKLAERCFSAGMISETHYLFYLRNPLD